MSYHPDLRKVLSDLDRLAENALAGLPLTGMALLRKMRADKEVAWEREDPFDSQTVWLSLHKGLARLDRRNGEVEKLGTILGRADLRAIGVGFTETNVLFGTQRGLVAYVRATRSWSQLAPGGQFGLMHAPVLRISQDGDLVAVMMKPMGKPEQVWEYRAGKWKRK